MMDFWIIYYIGIPLALFSAMAIHDTWEQYTKRP